MSNNYIFCARFSIAYTHISGVICEKLHQDPNNDNCSIQRKKNLSREFFDGYSYPNLGLNYLVITKLLIDNTFGNIAQFFGMSEMKFLTSLIHFFIWSILYRFGNIFCYYLIMNLLIFCFVDPLTLEQFGNWVFGRLLAFTTACLVTFPLWIFGICKIAYQKIKISVQEFFGLFYN